MLGTHKLRLHKYKSRFRLNQKPARTAFVIRWCKINQPFLCSSPQMRFLTKNILPDPSSPLRTTTVLPGYTN